MDWLTLIMSIVLGVLTICYIFSRRHTEFEKLGLLYVKPWPFVGNMCSVVLQRAHFTSVLDWIYKLNEDAEYIGYYDFNEPVIMIRSPELIKSITVKNFDHFVDHRLFVDPNLDPLFGKNLFALRGEKWKEVRTFLSPAFTSSKMKGMFVLMSNCAKNFVDYLTETSLEKCTTVDTKDAFTRYTTDVIATCAFGISVDSMRYPKNEFYLMGRETIKFDIYKMIQFFFMRIFPKTTNFLNMKFIPVKTEAFFTNVVKNTIETREREGITRPDVIQLMMEETRKRKSSGDPELTIQDITAQAFIFFLGGFESSSTLMCFLAHQIATHPKVQAKLRDEVDKVIEDTNNEITYDAINGMQYLDAVVNETLRLFPVTPILDRTCVKAFELPAAFPGNNPITIQPGRSVIFPVFSIHRDPKYFSNPDTFDPERFMDDNKKNIDPFTYFPFGQGPRMCIGNRFALLENKVLIFHLLSKCHLKLSPKTAFPLELSKKNFFLIPKGDFWLEIEPRSVCTEK